MNISIYLPVCLVWIFLYGCVLVSFLGLGLLLVNFFKKVLDARHFYWVAILIITMRANKTREWTYGMFDKLRRELREENPECYNYLFRKD